jgi:hypothetical protein
LGIELVSDREALERHAQLRDALQAGALFVWDDGASARAP